MPTIRLLCAISALFWVTFIKTSSAEGFLDRDWLLDPKLSNVYMQTVKANSIFETHQFTSVEGSVSKDGEASLTIDLATLDTGIDVRDVRMRFLMFETFKYPTAEIRASLDKDNLLDLPSRVRMVYPLAMTVNMHGIEQSIETLVWVTMISETTISVTTIKPIVITTDSFDFTKNLDRLIDVIGGTSIATGASITFDLVFSSGELSDELMVERVNREKQRAEEAVSIITNEGCETRLEVISQTNAIYFAFGSAELDSESEPLLKSLADIARRCPAVKIEIAGHTDSVGSKTANQELSEKRAQSVQTYLVSNGVEVDRVQSAGYGDTRPIAANDSEVSRARNRRIEFTVN